MRNARLARFCLTLQRSLRADRARVCAGELLEQRIDVVCKGLRYRILECRLVESVSFPSARGSTNGTQRSQGSCGGGAVAEGRITRRRPRRGVARQAELTPARASALAEVHGRSASLQGMRVLQQCGRSASPSDVSAGHAIYDGGYCALPGGAPKSRLQGPSESIAVSELDLDNEDTNARVLMTAVLDDTFRPLSVLPDVPTRVYEDPHQPVAEPPKSRAALLRLPKHAQDLWLAALDEEHRALGIKGCSARVSATEGKAVATAAATRRGGGRRGMIEMITLFFKKKITLGDTIALCTAAHSDVSFAESDLRCMSKRSRFQHRSS